MFGKVKGVVLSAFLVVVATSCSVFALPLVDEFQHRQCSVFVLDVDAIDGECLLGALSLLPQEKTGVPVSTTLSQGPHRPDGYRHLLLPGFPKQLTMALVHRHEQDVSRGSSDMLYGGVAFDKLAETVQTIPEPTTMMLLGAGLVTLAGVIRRRMERR